MKQKIKSHLANNDHTLKRIINQIDFPIIESTNNVFHDLMSCIIEQQIHYRSTKKTFQKIMDSASLDILTPDNFHLFEEKGFKNIKLSTQKFETILRIVEFFESNKIDWTKKEDQEVRKILSEIKGVGIWTIEMILLYTLERPDIFPADDYHIKQIMNKMYEIDPSSRVKAQMKKIAEHWSPYKSYAVKYLLAWKAFEKKATRSLN